MKLFHRKSKWEKLVGPVTSGKPASAVRSGLTAAGSMVAVTLVSAAVSAVRNRNSDA